MNKTDKLQQLCDQLKKPYHYNFQVEYRRNLGWYAVDEDGSRFFGDEGEYLGSDFARAKKTLQELLT